jgi:hypothetical protein
LSYYPQPHYLGLVEEKGVASEHKPTLVPRKGSLSLTELLQVSMHKIFLKNKEILDLKNKFNHFKSETENN